MRTSIYKYTPLRILQWRAVFVKHLPQHVCSFPFPFPFALLHVCLQLTTATPSHHLYMVPVRMCVRSATADAIDDWELETFDVSCTHSWTRHACART